MTVTVDGTNGVTTPSVTYSGAASCTLLPPTSGGSFTQTLPAGNGELVLTTVVMNFPTTLGNSGDTLITDGAGNLSWVAGGGGGSGTVTSVTVATVAGMGLSWTGTNPITTSGTFTLGGTLNPSNGGTGLTALGTGVQVALGNGANTNGGFLLAGAGGVLPVTQGGTGLSALGGGVQVALGIAAGAANGFPLLDATGVLPVSNGGTGITALGAGVQVALGIAAGTGAGFPLLAGGILPVAQGGTGISSLGAGVQTALGAAAGTGAGFATLTGGILPIAQGGTGLSALGTGVQTALGNATNSANGISVLDAAGLVPVAQGGTGLGTIGAAGETIVSDGTNYIFGHPASSGGVLGGNPWEILYQSATDVTSFVAAGVTGEVLGANTGAAPAWVSGDITIGTTAIPLGGSATVISGVDTINLTQDPTSGLEAATKQYVDAKTAGLQDIGVAKAATTGDITRSGPQTIDTISVVAGDIVLVKNQTNPAENGLYEVQAAAWTYASSANTWAEYPSAVVFVQQGATNANSSWIQTNLDPAGIIGTTSQTWVIQSSPVTSYSAGTGINILVNQISNTGVLSVSGGSTGLTYDNATGTCALQGTLAATNGGTGLTALGTGVSTALSNAVNAASGIVTYDGTIGAAPKIAGSTSGTLTLAAQATASGTLTLPNGPGTILASSAALTQGSVLFAGASGAIAENNAEFFWDNGTNRLGIGTATPASEVQVVGTVTVGDSATDGEILLYQNANTDTVSIKSGSNTATWVMQLPPDAGTANQVLSTDGTGITSWTTVAGGTSIAPKWVNAATTAVAGDEIWVDTSGAAVTITLPSSPAAGDVVTINRIGANNVIVARNTKTILGSATDFVINVNHNGGRFVYLNTTWQVQKTQLGS